MAGNGSRCVNNVFHVVQKFTTSIGSTISSDILPTASLRGGSLQSLTCRHNASSLSYVTRFASSGVSPISRSSFHTDYSNPSVTRWQKTAMASFRSRVSDFSASASQYEIQLVQKRAYSSPPSLFESVQNRLQSSLPWLKSSKSKAENTAKRVEKISPPLPANASTQSIRSFVGKALKNPSAAVSRVAGKYREATGLQLEALWRQYYPFFLGAIALFAVLLLWRMMYGIASSFISISEGLAKYGFLALASATVAFTGLYLRARYLINPDAVYRRSIRMLQMNAQVLEVLGAPLTGSEVRAYVMSGGRLRLKNWTLGLSSRRCFLLFPIRGAERKGLVSVDVKKKDGKYNFKLLAVDVPTSAEDQRLYVIGEEKTYVDSGGVMSELRDPVVRALAKQKDFDAEDDREEDEEKAVSGTKT